MATETLNVSSVATKNGWTGTDADVFEALASADGNILNNAQLEGDALLLNIDDSIVADGDTVTNISINTRCARGANANDSLTAQLYIGGSPIGVAQDFASQGGTLADTTLSNSGNLNDPTAGTGWNEDRTAAEMDGLQIELVPTQASMPANVDIDFDCLDVVVTYTPGATPVTSTGAQTLVTATQSGTGTEEFTGAGAQALAGLGQTGMGAEEFIGSGAQSFAGLGQAGTAVMQPAGTGAQALQGLLQAGTGAEEIPGSGAQAFAAPSQQGTATEEMPGVGAQTLTQPSQAGVGLMHPDGAGVQTLAALSQVGTGSTAAAAATVYARMLPGYGIVVEASTNTRMLPGYGIVAESAAAAAGAVTSTAAQTLAVLSQLATGSAETVGTGAQVLQTVTQAGTGVEEIPGAGAQNLAVMSQVGTGAMQPSGAGAQTLGQPAQEGTGTAGSGTAAGTGAQTLQTVAQVATGVESVPGAGAQNLVAMEQAGTGIEIFIGAGAQSLQTAGQQGTGTETLTGLAAQLLPALAQVGTGIMLPDGAGAQTLASLSQVGTALFIAGEHRVETIMDAIIAAATGLTTTGANVYRARAYPVEVDGMPAVVVLQGNDLAVTQLLADKVTSMLSVSIDAIVRVPATQIDTTLNLIREEVTVAIMADYTLGLAYVEGIMELSAEEPEISGDGDAPIARMSLNWEVTYHHGRTDPAS